MVRQRVWRGWRGDRCAPVACPAAAAASVRTELVAGTQAEALVAARGTGQALAILPDARQLLLLRADAFSGPVQLDYGRAPDARLPGGVLP